MALSSKNMLAIRVVLKGSSISIFLWMLWSNLMKDWGSTASGESLEWQVALLSPVAVLLFGFLAMELEEQWKEISGGGSS